MVRRSRRKVIGIGSTFGKLIAGNGGTRRGARRGTGWFGQWYAEAPPWYAVRRASEIKRRKR